MISVGVSGAAGRMGSLVARTVAGQEDLALVGAYDPHSEGGRAGDVDISADPSSLDGADVVVEFTRPDVVMENLARWRHNGACAVVGTSGFDAERIGALRDSWGTGPPNCIVVPNFSIGAVMMMHLAEVAAPHFDASEIIELHHDNKADAPSGTALETARRIAGAGGSQRRAVDAEELTAGALGASVGEERVHSIRLPGLVAHQEVIFGGPGETLSIRHDTTDRASFMPGVLLAVRAVGGLADPVTIGLEGLLGLD